MISIKRSSKLKALNPMNLFDDILGDQTSPSSLIFCRSIRFQKLRRHCWSYTLRRRCVRLTDLTFVLNFTNRVRNRYYKYEEMRMASQWYNIIDEIQYGPVSSVELRNIDARGQLLPSCLVWKQGLKNR
jgi:hypothetical protein